MFLPKQQIVKHCDHFESKATDNCKTQASLPLPPQKFMLVHFQVVLFFTKNYEEIHIKNIWYV